eukprot:COSAG02_NODE_4976_length_4763_cov_57.094554_7_plen_37_part_01
MTRAAISAARIREQMLGPSLVPNRDVDFIPLSDRYIS